MIPVHPQPEPVHFDTEVRKKGSLWLLENPDAKSEKLPPYWRKVNEALWSAYGGVCAYLAVYFEFVTGASTTDHFIPKSVEPSLAYEWSNYRLSSLGANRRKGVSVILDPFDLESESFFLDILTGAVYPNPEKAPDYKHRCEETIQTLGLNDARCISMRLEHIQQYLTCVVSEAYLQAKSPFVYYELRRQQVVPVAAVPPEVFTL